MPILTENLTAYDPVFEVYYGKPPEFIKVEKMLDVIIDEAHNQLNFKKNNERVDINDLPEVTKIEKIFKNFFDVEEFELTFYSLYDIDPRTFGTKGNNAFAMISGLSFLKRDKKNKKRVDPTKLYINVNIDIGFIVYNDLTSPELLSIILHEVGHQFDASIVHFVSDIIGIIPDLLKMKDSSEQLGAIIGTVLASSKIGTKLRVFDIKLISAITSKIPKANAIIKTAERIIATYKINYYGIKRLINGVNIKRVLMDTINPKNIFGYGAEKFADSFATSYGYGPELSSVMVKLDKYKYNLVNAADIPVLNIGSDLIKTSTDIALFGTDPHPSNITRINNQLNKLKRDINDPTLTPKIKHELQEQIDRCEKIIEDMTSVDSANDGRVFSFLYNYLIIKIFKGKLDPREFINFNSEL